MKFIKTILSMLVGLLVCPDTCCDGAVRIQVHDIEKGADKTEKGGGEMINPKEPEEALLT